ncbi:MAG: hypothetical protein FWE44_07470 [Defluviitaleaceae bacterium]|nr:hypothetical protein [Defluviitaleaceae bacterium]
MSNESIMFAVINILAIIIIPIAAVFIGQHLQKRAKIRDDKMNIFRLLMANRHLGWSSRECVLNLNIIEVVFHDAKNVREQWRLYYEYLSVPKESFSYSTLETKQIKLLEAIADNLGYKDTITWETIKNSYMSTGLSDYMRKEQQILDGQAKLAELIDVFTKILYKISNSQTFGKDILKSLLNDLGAALSDLFSDFFRDSNQPKSESDTPPKDTPE